MDLPLDSLDIFFRVRLVAETSGPGRKRTNDIAHHGKEERCGRNGIN